MNKLNIGKHDNRRSSYSYNPKFLSDMVERHSDEIEKMAETINWLIDQIVAIKSPASTSVDLVTNKEKTIKNIPATKD